MDNLESTNTDETNVEQTTESTGGAQESTPPVATDENSSQAEGSKQEAAPSSETEDKVDFVKDSEGKEYVPKDVFEKRIAKIIAERNDLRQFAATLESDPEARKQYLSRFNDEPKADNKTNTPSSSSNIGQDEPSPEWKQFVGSYPKENQEAIVGFAKGYTSVLFPSINNMISKAISEAVNPIKDLLGKQTLDTFFKNVPEASAHQKEIAIIMKKHPTLNINEAARLAMYDKTFAKGKEVQQKAQTSRQIKINQTPINKGSNTPSSTKGTGSNSIDEGIQRAFNKLGI